MSKKSSAEAPAQSVEPSQASPLLLALAWSVPGLGHLLLKQYRQAAVFAFVIFASFITGLLLSGELATPSHGNPFSVLATAGCIANGVIYFLCKLFGLGHGDATAAGFNVGNAYLYTAGVMNLLAILDVSDIASGRKS